MSATGIGSLSTLIKRLEAATCRLEDIALHQSQASGIDTAFPTPTSSNAPTPPPPPPAPPAPAPEEEESPLAKEWDTALTKLITEYQEKSNKIGGPVNDQATLVLQTLQEQKNIISIASKCIKPPQSKFLSLLTPIQTHLNEVTEIRDKNRGDKKLFNHLSTVSEGLAVVGWVTVDVKPNVYVTEMRDSAQFYANRVFKDFKGECLHTDWCKSFMALIEGVRVYVANFHPSGLVWKSDGVELDSFLSERGTTAVSTSVVPAVPVSKVEGVGMGAVFGELNQGEKITRKLKKVDPSQMNHKNPDLKDTPARTVKPGPPKPVKPAQFKVNKPAQTVLDGNKWMVENHVDDQSIVIEETELNQTVNIFNCKNCLIQIKGKINALQMSNCTKTSLLVDTLVSSLEITGSKSVGLQITGKAPMILLDDCDSVQIFLTCLETEIVSAKCSSVNVNLPNSHGEFQEFPLPEQFRHTIDNFRIQSNVVAHIG